MPPGVRLESLLGRYNYNIYNSDIQYTIYNIQYTIYNIQYTIYIFNNFFKNVKVKCKLKMLPQ